MIEEVRLPEISENVDTGDVIKVLVKPGDFVEKEQSLVELETEKAAFEVPSPVKGKVVEVKISNGDKIKVGQVIVTVDTEAKPGEQAKPQEKEQPKPEKKGPEPEPPPRAETVKQKPRKPEPRKEVSKPEPQEETIEEPKAGQQALPAAPSVRQLARDLGVDISKVSGTGPAGRISAEDVKNYVKVTISGGIVPQASVQYRALPDFAKWGDIERHKVTVTRKKIADTLTYTWANVPQVTQYDKADITNLEEFRREYSNKVQQAGGKLTVTSILLKVVASALKEFPVFNASYDAAAEEIIYKKYCHISVAVDTDRGLLVPVVRDVDNKSILELSVELSQLAEKTRQHKVMPDEMVGGNFTISNLGGIGGTYFAPIIYWPQAAILGVARAVRQPVYINGVCEPRLILPLSLSYDHRIIDGVQGLRFIRRIAESLEKPFLLTLGEKIE
jgi:pyruvate dehydrogenase E2 component (dihydrolipoamide acetyltransferase)